MSHVCIGRIFLVALMLPRLVGRVYLKGTYSLHSEHQGPSKVVHVTGFLWEFFLVLTLCQRVEGLMEGGSLSVIIFYNLGVV